MDADPLFDVVIQLIQIDVRPKLAGQTTNRQTPVVARAVDNCIDKPHGIPACDAAAKYLFEDLMIDGRKKLFNVRFQAINTAPQAVRVS